MGGLNRRRCAIAENLAHTELVFRGDGKCDYASIDHEILYDHGCSYIQDRRVRDLIWAYMHRTVYEDGIYRDIELTI